MKLNQEEKNRYYNLKAQADSIFKHIRTGSYSTRRRYYPAFLRFLMFLAVEFQSQKISNISGKHLCAYINYLEGLDRRERYIKTELSAIRFVHDYIPGAKYKLPDNEHLAVELPKRVFGDTDRSWTQKEFEHMCEIAHREGCLDYANAMTFARYSGLRLHETFRLDAAAARKAVRENLLTVKGKGGKIREIPLAPESRAVLADQLSRTKPGEKLFVESEERTDLAMMEMERFILKYRNEVRDPAMPIHMTYHGLRHSYAAEQYRRLRTNGVCRFDAYLKVSKLLGHHRGEVTRLYIAFVDESEF